MSVKVKALKWILTHFYKDWAICYNTKHSYMAGIYSDKKHSLIANCEIKETVYGIYLSVNSENNLLNNIIIDTCDTGIHLDTAKLEGV
jgi:parallel beta-helix repeat protein